ncbi:nucleoside hydrolase-like domain-containing protein [Stieleria neptunia]|uniref:nucleoside hydrolase-like domain-containing protein n=1 Tax=Stieleria neptunia TaxID=2527979 RepID=UPI001E3DF532|nr:nucleoside hydrolase-like domain-containing protein [Stieleria neptunia]
MYFEPIEEQFTAAEESLGGQRSDFSQSLIASFTTEVTSPETRRMHLQRIYAAFLITMVASVAIAQEDQSQRDPYEKPRIITTTDLGADPDDEQSLVRLLVSANEFDMEGLIVSTGCWKKSQGDTKMLDKLVDAYGECVGNLKVHADGFPSVDYLRKISVMGQRGYGMSDVGDGKDSPGSDLIIASVDKDDPRPVWIGGWGGTNNVAQAIWKVRATRSKAELDKFLSKIRVFDILGQDDAGAWIAKNYPEVLYIRATGVYGWQPPKNGDYQRNDIQSHGPLGALYPDTKWATEGDTPAFMHVYPNGLNDPDQIDQGGWGGRFSWKKKTSIKSMRAVKGEERQYDPYDMYGNTSDGAKAIKRWSKGYDNDFAARMDWSITSKYEDANHHPIAVLNGDTSRRVMNVSAAPGSTVSLSAKGSSDPDKNALTYAWSFYQDPSSYDGDLKLNGYDSESVKISVPADAAGKNMHIILEVHDDGEPNLYAYRRMIVNVDGESPAASTATPASPPAKKQMVAGKPASSMKTWLKNYIADTYPDAELEDHGGWLQAHVGDLVVSWAEWNEAGVTLKELEAHALKDGRSIFISKDEKQDWILLPGVDYLKDAGYFVKSYLSASMSAWNVEGSTVIQFDGDAKEFSQKLAAAWSGAASKKPAAPAAKPDRDFNTWLKEYIPANYAEAKIDDHGGWTQAHVPNLVASWALWNESGITLKEVHDVEEGESLFISKNKNEDWPESDQVKYFDGAGYYVTGYSAATMADWDVEGSTVVQFDGDSKAFAEKAAVSFSGPKQPKEQKTSSKPFKRLRVVMTTDFPPIGVVKGGNVPNDQKSDPDDMQSIVRFLLYANEFDVEGLVVSSGTFANKATKKNMLDVIDRYEQVYPNLKKHDSMFPSPAYLRSVTFEGRSGTWGKKGTTNIGEGKDSEASDALIAIVDKPDPRPVYVGIWGDCSVVAQAVWKVQQTRSKSELDQFLSKLRIHQIATQDGTITWLRDNFPKLFIIHSHKTYQGMFGGGDPNSDLAWVNRHIRNDHGPLCSIYPHEGMGCIGVCEGDSPAFLWLVSANRGLNDPDDPTQESWGGQFKRDGDKNHFIDGPGRSSISKWRKDFQKEFAERADWCVRD